MTRKVEVLPVIATLAAALVAIATLNKDLVPLTAIETKSILSIFLFLIPVTFFYYIKVAEKTAINAMGIIRSYHKDDPFKTMKPVSFVEQLASDFPILVVYLLFGVVLLVLFVMWFL